MVVARDRLEVRVARPETCDVLQRQGVPAEACSERLLGVGRCAQLRELLVEGVEVLLVVLVKVDGG